MVRKKTKTLIAAIMIISLVAVAFIFLKVSPFATFGTQLHGGRFYSAQGDSNWDMLFEQGNTVIRGDMYSVTLFWNHGTAGGTPTLTGTAYLFDETGKLLSQSLATALNDRNDPLKNFYLAFPQFNSSALSPGSHTLFISMDNALTADQLQAAVNDPSYAALANYGKNPLAYGSIYVQPAVCNIGAGNAEVSRVLTAGQSFSKNTFTDYPVVGVCDKATGVLRSDTLQTYDDYSITSNFGNGTTQTVPPSQVWELHYIAKKTWTETCDANTPYDATLKGCYATGLIRPCGSTGVLEKDGTCYQIPTSLCPATTYFNASISTDACIIDRCPSGSQWETAINACAIRISYNDVCGTVGGTYQAPNTTANTQLTGMCLTPDGQLKPPQFACPANTVSVSKNENYYCQYGASQLLNCPQGTISQNGVCIATQTLTVTQVKTDTIVKQMPIPVVVTKYIGGVPLPYVLVIVAIAAIIIMALLYVYWRKL